jgi:hypothetical protein
MMGLPILGDIITTVGNLAGKFIKDKDQIEAFKHEIDMSLTQMDLAQMEVNKVEAAHRSIFVAGWRPFIGWTCGIALALEFLVRPIAQWGLLIAEKTITLPNIDNEALYPILMGLLGLGTLRTYEKFKGVSK